MKLKILKFLIIFIILTSLIMPVFGEEDMRKDPTCPLTKEEIQKRIDLTPPTNPEVLNQLKKDESILAIYGEIPERKGEDAYDWWISIDNIAYSIAVDGAFEKYHYDNGGTVIGFGPSCDGYIQITIYDELQNEVSSQDITEMKEIVEKYAAKKEIKNIPVVFRSSEMGQTSSSIENEHENAEKNILAAAPNYYSDKIRPIIGGISVYSSYTGPGTIGYVVKQTNNSSKRGFVTSAHLVDFQNISVYQPTVGILNGVGTSSVNATNKKVDAIYISPSTLHPFSVSAKIHTGNNQLVDVRGQLNPISGDFLKRSGLNTTSTSGYFIEYNYNYSLRDEQSGAVTFTLDKVGVMNGTTSQKKDSGGPIYIEGEGKVYIIGITQGHYGNLTIFVPCSEITSKLGVEALKMEDN
ncbi:hypothetical protein MsAg5_15850 [Methanosarcinaceae archaeon Ag5]|uniref:Uncharacterized protein n=2 Tax=Methanolapillus africanus TaxID=3028297 RepID=A0AAE4MK60_9EURY|nr:hypothetical protein [Methanosarcinaceae archaeon Ag5]